MQPPPPNPLPIKGEGTLFFALVLPSCTCAPPVPAAGFIAAPVSIAPAAPPGSIDLDARPPGSAEVHFELDDAHGVPTPMTADLSVALAAPGLALFSDSSCAGETPSIAVPKGSTSASFYFRGTAAGSFTLSISAPGLTSASQP